jgi:hypothetical protein
MISQKFCKFPGTPLVAPSAAFLNIQIKKKAQANGKKQSIQMHGPEAFTNTEWSQVMLNIV